MEQIKEFDDEDYGGKEIKDDQNLVEKDKKKSEVAIGVNIQT